MRGDGRIKMVMVDLEERMVSFALSATTLSAIPASNNTCNSMVPMTPYHYHGS